MKAILQTLGSLFVEFIKFFIFPAIAWCLKFMYRHVFVAIIVVGFVLTEMAQQLGHDDALSYENVRDTKKAVGYAIDSIKNTEFVKVVSNTNTVKGLKKDVNYISDKVDDVAEYSDTYKGFKKDLGIE